MAQDTREHRTALRDVNGLATKEEFSGTGAVVSYLTNGGDIAGHAHETYDNRARSCIRSSNYVCICGRPIELHTSAALPIVRGVTLSRPIVAMPQDIFGNTLAPIMHDPSGSTLTPWAMSRGGR
jgi:hypothetical protein